MGWGVTTTVWKAPSTSGTAAAAPKPVSGPILTPTKPPASVIVPRNLQPVYKEAPGPRSFGLTPDAQGEPAPISWGLLLVIAVGLYFAVKR